METSEPDPDWSHKDAGFLTPRSPWRLTGLAIMSLRQSVRGNRLSLVCLPLIRPNPVLATGWP